MARRPAREFDILDHPPVVFLLVLICLGHNSSGGGTGWAVAAAGQSEPVCNDSAPTHQPEPARLLAGMRLLWPFSIYHAQLGEASVTQAAAATVAAVDNAVVDLTSSGVQELTEEVRRFVARTARETRNARVPCGYSPPHVDNVLLGRLSAAADGDEALYARSRFALRRLLEAHLERWAAGTWMHPLLEARSASAAAVRMSIAASSGYMLRANGRDAIWPCAMASRRAAGLAAVILVLDDGDQGCNNSSSGNSSASTWWMSDPRGGSAYRLPALFQLGADANVCARTSEVWVIPPGVPLTFPPHRSLRSRILVVADVKVEYVNEGALLAFLGAEDADADTITPSSEQPTGEDKFEGGSVGSGGGGSSSSGGVGEAPLLGTLIDGVSETWRLWRGRGEVAAGDGRRGGASDAEAVRRRLAANMLVIPRYGFLPTPFVCRGVGPQAYVLPAALATPRKECLSGQDCFCSKLQQAAACVVSCSSQLRAADSRRGRERKRTKHLCFNRLLLRTPVGFTYDSGKASFGIHPKSYIHKTPTTLNLKPQTLCHQPRAHNPRPH